MSGVLLEGLRVPPAGSVFKPRTPLQMTMTETEHVLDVAYDIRVYEQRPGFLYVCAPTGYEREAIEVECTRRVPVPGGWRASKMVKGAHPLPCPDVLSRTHWILER